MCGVWCVLNSKLLSFWCWPFNLRALLYSRGGRVTKMEQQKRKRKRTSWETKPEKNASEYRMILRRQCGPFDQYAFHNSTFERLVSTFGHSHGLREITCNKRQISGVLVQTQIVAHARICGEVIRPRVSQLPRCVPTNTCGKTGVETRKCFCSVPVTCRSIHSAFFESVLSSYE